MERISKKIHRCRADTGKIKKLFVYINTACNLKCSYCFYTTQKPETLSFEKFKKAYKKFIKIAQDPEITILGGEPLIDKNKIIKIINHTKLKSRITLFTNATLIDKRISEVIKKNSVNVVISIDGSKKNNDSLRKFKNSKISVYAQALSKLKKEGLINISSINMVVVPQTSKYLSSNVKHLFSLGFKSIGISIDYSSNWTIDDIKTLRREIKKLLIDYLKLIKLKKAYRFSNFYEIFNKIKGIKNNQCSNLILFPDGNFYLCDKIISMKNEEREKFRIKDNIIKEREKFFKKMEKKAILSNQLFCQTGIYLYLKYIKKMKGKDLKLRLKQIFRIQKEIEDIFTVFFNKLSKIKYFRYIHGL